MLMKGYTPVGVLAVIDCVSYVSGISKQQVREDIEYLFLLLFLSFLFLLPMKTIGFSVNQ